MVEIGTRNGDGMACFAHVAKRALAVEIFQPYCRKLCAPSRDCPSTSRDITRDGIRDIAAR